jgi:Helix-turn-helix domain
LSIGTTLAEARGQAGLTVTHVSQRTRIRETIIRDIERDDFSSCGGDFYARGHIRAIARAIGIDSAPLVAEYDSARQSPAPPQHSGPDSGPAAVSDRPRPEALGPAAHRPEAHAPQARAPEAHRPEAHRPEAHRPDGHSPATGYGITAAEAFRPFMPLERRRRRPNWTIGLAVLLLAAVAFLGYHFASSPGGSPRLSASHSSTPPKKHTAAPPTSSPSPSVTSIALTPATAIAFGPSGAGQGDNPGMASLALDGNASAGWQTDWYATPTFAGLQSGTGLLLDMGKSVTITSAQLTLAASLGATVELRIGDTPTLAGLQQVAQATNAGGTLRLQPSSPASGRYVLIWFTRLPPDSAGTYQETVSDVRLAGLS